MADANLMALKALASQDPEEMGEPGEPGQGKTAPGDGIMPMAGENGSSQVFVDKAVFGDEKVKRGQPILLYGVVTANGSKIAVDISKGTIDVEGKEDEMDEDLDDDMGAGEIHGK